MSDDVDARTALLEKLKQSREEIRQVLDPPRPETGGESAAGGAGSGFPRSRIMRTLLSNRGLGAAGALAGGLLIARPALALRLLRLLPVSSVGKMLIAKVMSGIGKREPR